MGGPAEIAREAEGHPAKRDGLRGGPPVPDALADHAEGLRPVPGGHANRALGGRVVAGDVAGPANQDLPVRLEVGEVPWIPGLAGAVRRRRGRRARRRGRPGLSAGATGCPGERGDVPFTRRAISGCGGFREATFCVKGKGVRLRTFMGQISGAISKEDDDARGDGGGASPMLVFADDMSSFKAAMVCFRTQ